jgi:NAD-dependent dihydropyrimidine dehydrogenase PreA subunit
MAKTWYPVVDYLACTECGTCIAMCPHYVYDKTKAPSPVVKLPDECVDHCHGCGNRCPAGAITYVGDDTGWTPPHREQTQDEPCCDCGCGDSCGKKVLVEYLYLDLDSCERCIGTDNILDEVMMLLTPVLQMAGYRVEYNKIKVETAEIAQKYKFLSSPTIRVNGLDICQSVAENSCGCCSEISGTDVDCRVFAYNGQTYEVPPKEMLAQAILQAVFGQKETGCSCGDYVLPDNLKTFYEGKSGKSACASGGNCC